MAPAAEVHRAETSETGLGHSPHQRARKFPWALPTAAGEGKWGPPTGWKGRASAPPFQQGFVNRVWWVSSWSKGQPCIPSVGVKISSQ